MSLCSGCLFVSDKRTTSLQETINSIITGFPYITARKIAKLCGKILSTKLITGYVSQLKTRRLHYLIQARKSWDGRLNIVDFPDAMSEIFFWKNSFASYNYRILGETYNPPIRAYSDASGTGLAAHVCINGITKIAYRNLKCVEQTESSTFRELLAIEFALTSFQSYLKGGHVLWSTDNFAACSIAKRGSRNENLQSLSESIAQFCNSNYITFQTKWISRNFIFQISFCR